MMENKIGDIVYFKDNFDTAVHKGIVLFLGEDTNGEYNLLSIKEEDKTYTAIIYIKYILSIDFYNSYCTLLEAQQEQEVLKKRIETLQLELEKS